MSLIDNMGKPPPFRSGEHDEIITDIPLIKKWFIGCFYSSIPKTQQKFAQSAGAVEYTDCTSAEG